MKKLVIFIVMVVSLIVPFLTAQQNNNMVRINGGTFTMGSPANEAGRVSTEVQRQVTISAFWMGKYEVTQKEYQEIMGVNRSTFKGDNLPVENVTWFDAVEYCNKRSQKEGLTPVYTITGRTPTSGYPITAATVTANWNANGYRLPTEAEWEYACRAGTTTPFNTGNNILTSQANYNGNYPYNNNAKGENRGKTTPVGNFAANAWGLHDMHGNVQEWCWDLFGTYATGAQTNPRGAASGSYRMLRGGRWDYPARSLRSAVRDSNYSGYYYYEDWDELWDEYWDDYGVIGFRVVRL
ncbi:MAG: formylglycine-generating enzyme family protein [Treponema sp.]|nr:formylglycine-generating enzyme family protein [Treponema sp.]